MTIQKRHIIFLLTIAILLLIPLVAMQFTAEVTWTLSDFVIAGFMLLGTGILLEIIIRQVKKHPYRRLLIALLLVLFLLAWAELAVGVFGTPFAGS
jgi:ABC-type cobalt transport system substrate-binding protein